MTHPFIVFEGVDGAGKSTVSKMVADSLGAEHLESPINEFKKIRKFVEGNLSEKAKFLYYLASNFELSNHARTNKQIEPVVCARYVYSTLIGHASRQYRSIDDACRSWPVSPDEFEKPDLTIFLCLSEDEQRTRIGARQSSQNSAKDHQCLNDAVYQRHLFDNYASVAKKENWFTIDTTSMPVEQVVEKCIERIRTL